MDALFIASKTPAPTWDDDSLALSASQDPEAMSILYRRYVDRVYRYLFAKTGCVEDAEDLTAQVFTEVLESLPRYQPRGNFPGWLFTIAYRRVVNAHRTKSGYVPLEEAEKHLVQITDTLGNIIQAQRVEHLRTLLQELREDELELIRLRFYARLTYAQIGMVLKKHDTAVAMAMHRLLGRLETRWEEADE